MDKIKLSVVIPSYNESANLKNGVLDQVANYLKGQQYPYEVILVDDGSVDDTTKIIEKEISNKKNFRLIKNPHGGKAVTVMTGMLEAKGEIAIFTDTDQSTPLQEVEKFFPKFDQGYDIVIGSRDGREGAPIIRKLASFVFATLRNLILGLPFSDTQCGFKACNYESRQAIFSKMMEERSSQKVQGYSVSAGFDIEFLFRAKKLKFRIIDVPVDWHHVESKSYQLIKNAVDAIDDMIKIRLSDLKGSYR